MEYYIAIKSGIEELLFLTGKILTNKSSSEKQFAKPYTQNYLIFIKIVYVCTERQTDRGIEATDIQKLAWHSQLCHAILLLGD